MSYRGWQLRNLPPENPTWGVTELLISFIFYILIKYVFIYLEPAGLKLINYISTDADIQKLWFYLISVIISNILVFLLVIFLVKKRFSTIKELGITSINLFKGINLGFFSGLIIFLIVLGAGLALAYLFGIREDIQFFTENFISAKSWNPRLILYIIALLLIPLTHSILFQGLIYPVIRSITGSGPAIFLVGLIYAGSFFDLQRVLPLFFAGLILTYLYEESGNIFAPILANSIWQGLMLWLISFTSGK